MTAAIDRLVRKDLVTRRPNPEDRREPRRLTVAGRAAVDDAMARHADAEHALVAGLTMAERTELESLLRKLLLAVEHDG